MKAAVTIQYVGPIGPHTFIRGGYWGPSSYCRGNTPTGSCVLCRALGRRR